MDKDSALKVIQEVYDAFGFDDVKADESSALLPLILDGSLIFSGSTGYLEYTLKAPIDLKNEGKLTVVKFREPAASELEYIRKGMSVDREMRSIRTDDLVTITLRVLVKTGDLLTTLADRIKARDIAALQPVMVELGFFYR